MQLTNLVLLERIFKVDNISPQQVFNRIAAFIIRFLGSVPNDCVPTYDNETSVITKAQPGNMHCEHCLMPKSIRYRMYFSVSPGRAKCRFLKQNYKQMIPTQMQSHPTVLRFYIIFPVLVYTQSLLAFCILSFFEATVQILQCF